MPYADLLDAEGWRERWVAGQLTDTELGDPHGMFATYVEPVLVAPRVGRREVRPLPNEIWRKNGNARPRESLQTGSPAGVLRRVSRSPRTDTAGGAAVAEAVYGP